MKNYNITKQGFEKLKEELDYFKTVKRKELAKKLKKAISYGDLSENAEYEEAKEEQIFLEKKILELENFIKNAVIIEKGTKEKVQIGSKIYIKNVDKKGGGKQEEYEISGSLESDPLSGKISVDSPFGKSVLGLKKGSVFEVQTSKGKTKYKIIKIE